MRTRQKWPQAVSFPVLLLKRNKTSATPPGTRQHYYDPNGCRPWLRGQPQLIETVSIATLVRLSLQLTVVLIPSNELCCLYSVTRSHQITYVKWERERERETGLRHSASYLYQCQLPRSVTQMTRKRQASETALTGRLYQCYTTRTHVVCSEGTKNHSTMTYRGRGVRVLNMFVWYKVLNILQD